MIKNNSQAEGEKNLQENYLPPTEEAIMLEFAEEKDDENLISALHGDEAFKSFYDEINASRNLSAEFGMFQKNYYNKIFKKWCEDNNIAKKIKF